ncbi:nuclear transport factor 2 family protein [Shewanella surugensis]|uniref:nuclear transport factor 2 family protein n=1 Tax=Shewanella surugensis TaxID=212020 RepID=UPI0035E262ED
MDIIKNFSEAWVKKDLNGSLNYLSENCICNNTPVVKITGKDEIRDYFQNIFNAVDDIKSEFKSFHFSESGDVICEFQKQFTENGKSVMVEQMISFTIENEKIVSYSSYFDKSELTQLTSLGKIIRNKDKV